MTSCLDARTVWIVNEQSSAMCTLITMSEEQKSVPSCKLLKLNTVCRHISGETLHLFCINHNTFCRTKASQEMLYT